jgi:hypothetical protein
MKTVWKFPLDSDRSIIKAPGLGSTLLVDTQGIYWCAWCEVDTDKRDYAREFLIIGTGHPMPDDSEGFIHSNSWQQGPFVWHAYERPAPVD